MRKKYYFKQDETNHCVEECPVNKRFCIGSWGCWHECGNLDKGVESHDADDYVICEVLNNYIERSGNGEV